MNKPKIKKQIKGGKLDINGMYDAVILEEINIRLYNFVNEVSKKLNSNTEYQGYRDELTNLIQKLRGINLEYSSQIFPLIVRKELTISEIHKQQLKKAQNKWLTLMKYL